MEQKEDPRLTFEDVLKLLGVEELPFPVTPALKGLAIRGMQDMLKRNGEDWVKRNRRMLIDSLEHVATLM